MPRLRTAEEAADQWALFSHNGGKGAAHRTIHHITERETLTERWHGAFRDWSRPLSLAWGLMDPVATTRVLDGLRQLRPALPVRELPDLGHYPQLEDPDAIRAALSEALVTAE